MWNHEQESGCTSPPADTLAGNERRSQLRRCAGTQQVRRGVNWLVTRRPGSPEAFKLNVEGLYFFCTLNVRRVVTREGPRRTKPLGTDEEEEGPLIAPSLRFEKKGVAPRVVGGRTNKDEKGGATGVAGSVHPYRCASYRRPVVSCSDRSLHLDAAFFRSRDTAGVERGQREDGEENGYATHGLLPCGVCVG